MSPLPTKQQPSRSGQPGELSAGSRFEGSEFADQRGHGRSSFVLARRQVIKSFICGLHFGLGAANVNHDSECLLCLLSTLDSTRYCSFSWLQPFCCAVVSLADLHLRAWLGRARDHWEPTQTNPVRSTLVRRGKRAAQKRGPSLEGESLSLVWIGPEAQILSVFAAACDGSNVLAGKPVNLAGVVSPQRG